MALIDFAGHGFQIGDVNYLLPTDFGSEDDQAEAERQGYSVKELITRLKQKHIRLGIIILDTCRDNPYAEKRSFVADSAPDVNVGPDFFIAYSTSPRETAYDGSGSHSPFTAHLIDTLRNNPDLSLDELFSRVGAAVRAEVPQTGWSTHTPASDFHFRPR